MRQAKEGKAMQEQAATANQAATTAALTTLCEALNIRLIAECDQNGEPQVIVVPVLPISSFTGVGAFAERRIGVHPWKQPWPISWNDEAPGFVIPEVAL